MRFAEVNGQPRAVFTTPHGTPFSVLALDIGDG